MKYTPKFHEVVGPVVLIFSLLALLTLLTHERAELIPQTMISIVVAIISYLAYWHSRSKLRLDLFDRRFQIYEYTLTYCSVVAEYASLERRQDNKERIDEGLKAAHESFRSIGLHKTKALFGQDIVDLFERLNRNFAYIHAFGRLKPGDNGYNSQEYWSHVEATFQLTSDLPDHFKPYLYFGDIRR